MSSPTPSTVAHPPLKIENAATPSNAKYDPELMSFIAVSVCLNPMLCTVHGPCHTTRIWQRRERVAAMPATPSKSQLEPAASLIAFSASSTVKVFGFCTAGKSLNVAANFAAPACAA